MKNCPSCGNDKPVAEFYSKGNGLSTKCKPCQLDYNRKNIQLNKVDNFFSRTASDIRRRTDPDRCPQKSKVYIDRGIKCLLGDTTKEVASTLKNLFKEQVAEMIQKGEKPSIDRIDPYGNYEVSNIRVITYEENVSNRIASSNTIKATFADGSTAVYRSILEAATQTGSNRSTIKEQLKNGAKFNKRGIKFERAETDGK